MVMTISKNFKLCINVRKIGQLSSVKTERYLGIEYSLSYMLMYANKKF